MESRNYIDYFILGTNMTSFFLYLIVFLILNVLGGKKSFAYMLFNHYELHTINLIAIF